MSHTRPSYSLCIVLMCTLLPLAACGDDSPDNSSTTSSQTSETTPQTTPQTTSQTTSQTATPDVGEEEDVEEDTAPDVEEDVTPDAEEDVTPDIEEDVPFQGGGECETTDDCEHETRQCIEGVCTLVPAETVYVENNYILEEPAELANVVSVLKGFLSQTGFFMTQFGPLDENGEMLVVYGGGDVIETVDDGPNIYAWQIADPSRLPTFTVRPDIDPDDPTAGNAWISDIFDYRLVAAFEFNGQRSGIGFEAQETVVRMTFSPDQNNIIGGTIQGFMTRAEAEGRVLTLGEDCEDPNSLCCLLSTGVCPAYECGVSEVMDSVADVLDCNGAVIDSDVDPDVEGHDAYRVVINFSSELVTLQEDAE